MAARAVTRPGGFAYIPGMVPHGMGSFGEEPAAFPRCIANVHENE